MARSDVKVNVPVIARILLHLWEQDHQADHYLVTHEMTRPGIAEICALHPPNVSRSMRELMSNGWVTEHTRTVRGDDRRQKTWQLTEEGRAEARDRIDEIRSTMILLRSSEGRLLEVRADEAAVRLKAGLTLLQVLMHAQHEGVLNFGDIRFGAIVRSDEAATPPPGSLSLLAGRTRPTTSGRPGLAPCTVARPRGSDWKSGTRPVPRCSCSRESPDAARPLWPRTGSTGYWRTGPSLR